MRDTRADIEIDWHLAIADAAASLVRALPADIPQPLPVVPSSLRQDDPLVASLRAALRDRGVRSAVLTPRSPAALLTRLGGSAWRTATVDDHRWRIDARVAGPPWVAVVDVVAGREAGPFALDLPARFLHPADRILLAARADRLRALADVAAIASPAACLVLTPADGGWLAVTTRDPIAAELWALGLAERYHDAALEMQGPWEEPTVQRATELGLGIRIPGDMRVAATVPPEASVARSLLQRTAERLGLSLDGGNATG
jgi:hypothetical protein